MKFSIVMPCYNVGDYLSMAVDSVLRQSDKDWECICVDDGSTDNTPAILDKYAAADSRVVVIHQPNGGEGAARNAGISKAKGDFLVFLDGDDVLHPEALSRCRQAIDACPNVDGVCYGKVRGADPEFHPLAPFTYREIDTRTVINDSQFLWAYVWQHAYRRSLMADVKFRSYIMSADATYVAYYLSRVRSVCIISDVLYGYRVRAGSIINSRMSERKWYDSIQAYHEIMGVLSSSGKKFCSDYADTVAKFLVINPLKRLRHFKAGEILKMIRVWRKDIYVLRSWRNAPIKYRAVSYLFGSSR